MTIGLSHYLTVAAILFTIGIFGIFLNRKNVIVILMSIELMPLARRPSGLPFWLLTSATAAPSRLRISI